MAERVAAGDGEVPREPRIRPIPALHLHYGHRLLAELDARGPIPLSVLLDQVGDVEQLFKGERTHRSPLERARQLMRFAQELGLVRTDGGELSLTDVGRRYVRAGDPDDVFATTGAQRRVVRNQIIEGVRDGAGIATGVALTVAIVAKRGEWPSPSVLEIGEELGRRGGMTGWRQPRTFASQAERFIALAADAGLMDALGEVSPDGLMLVRELQATAPGLMRPAPATTGSAPAARGVRPRAWIVRAGREGMYERLAVSEGVCLIGWSELGPLPPSVTRDRLKEQIKQTYDEHRPRSLGSQAGQVYRFVEEIAVGDAVVLPLMGDAGHVAVGRVRGAYAHRDDGPFAGTDAQHTRPVEWIATRVPYTRFDADLRAAFGQQGTVSEIGAPHAAERILAAADASAIHLVLKWSARLAPDTIERHLDVEREHGAVWWGRVSRPGATGLSSRWVDVLRKQIAEGVPTSVFLRGETTWHGRLLAITTDRAEVEEALVPAYYDPATHHSLWVKLTDLREIDPGEIVAGYTLAQGGKPVTERGLGNQTPLILRGPPRDEDDSAAAPARGERSQPLAPPPAGVFDEAEAPPQPDASSTGRSTPPRPSTPPPRLRATPARPLDLPTLRRVAARHKLELPDEVYAHVVAVLQSGKHVILTGPPGTAKTTLATAIAEAAADVGMCRGHVPTTATADWTTNETIGGLRPTANNELAFEEGHFVTAIADDRWLLIDELNRSQFDRAFGQLFTVLSGHRVVLPYCRTDGDGPLALVPHDDRASREGLDVIEISPSWRIVATMNVFDKTLLFDMSYALMRRFGFVEVGSPEPETFDALIDRCAGSDARAADVTRRLLALRRFKDVGPAVYMDIARFLRARIALGTVTDERLLFEAFYSYLLPQFEGIQGRAGAELHDVVAELVGAEHRARLRATLTTVLGLELSEDAAAEVEEDDAGLPDAA